MKRNLVGAGLCLLVLFSTGWVLRAVVQQQKKIAYCAGGTGKNK